jgi:dihydroneopterin aldolase
VKSLEILAPMPFDTGDEIHIEELELHVRIGVPDAERAQPQRLTVSMSFSPRADFRALQDELTRTIDYAAVCAEAQRFAERHSAKLIETLADELAAHLLATFPIARIRLEIRKFILPDTRYVAVSVVR